MGVYQCSVLEPWPDGVGSEHDWQHESIGDRGQYGNACRDSETGVEKAGEGEDDGEEDDVSLGVEEGSL